MTGVQKMMKFIHSVGGGYIENITNRVDFVVRYPLKNFGIEVDMSRVNMQLGNDLSSIVMHFCITNCGINGNLPDLLLGIRLGEKFFNVIRCFGIDQSRSRGRYLIAYDIYLSEVYIDSNRISNKKRGTVRK